MSPLALAPGTRLGVYEITAPLGEGGMGQVYRATDTTLGRQVAIKLLPDVFASDPDRMARFEREAKTLASLNHPNIAAIYGFEKFAGMRALVMELVEGDDLSQRIARGAIPFDEALPLAKQIADALEVAHEQGIIHRDLKPANIKVRSDGTVKVLDFGLAKAIEPVGSASNVSQSPTITTPALTQAGVILGTAAYMSPEQARGNVAGKRADVWAFGCVLFEMHTGVRPFSGETVTETLAAVLMREPDWSVLPDDVPPPIRVLLRRCLEKNVGRRLADIAAVLVLIDELSALTAPTPLVAEPSVSPPARSAVVAAAHRDLVRASRRNVMLALAGGMMLAVLTGLIVWFALRPGSPTIVRTMVTPSGPTVLSMGGFDRDVAITPDGSRIVYRGTDQLLVRSLGSLEPTVLVAGGSPQGVFVSPDGQWVGFFEGSGTLRKVAITGGPATTLAGANARFPRGATWGDDGAIVFGIQGDLRRVMASGGESDVFMSPDHIKGETEYRWPEFLPGSEALLCTIDSQEGPQIAAIDVHARTAKTLVRGGSGARYLATGHLIYGVGANLLAVPFDLRRLEVTGAPVVVLQDIAMTAGGGVNVAVSRTGTLAYLPGAGGSAGERSLVWVDRMGREQPVAAPPRTYQIARLSPDGTRAALDIRDQGNDLWIWAFGSQTLTRLTSAPGNDMFPVWTRDSQRVIFAAAPNKEGRRDLAWRAADGSTPVERLVEGRIGSYYRPDSLANASTLLVDLNSDILTLDISSAGRQQGARPTPLLQTPFAEQNAEVSPDGRWVAFQSNESGGDEIYVRPFPNVEKGRALVSTRGGRTPLWSQNGQELFYRAPDGAVMSVRVVRGPIWHHDPATQVVRAGYFHAGEVMRTFDVALDGSRFLMIKPHTGTTDAPRSIVLVQHWFEELQRLVPSK